MRFWILIKILQTWASPLKSQNGTKVPLMVNLIVIVMIAERDEEAQVNTLWDHAFSCKIQQWCSVLFEFLFRKISFLKPLVRKDKNCETSGIVRVNQLVLCKIGSVSAVSCDRGDKQFHLVIPTFKAQQRIRGRSSLTAVLPSCRKRISRFGISKINLYGRLSV